MSDLLTSPLLSSVEGDPTAASDGGGGFLLPPFWDAAMARYGAQPAQGWLFVSDNVELLMRHMMREPMIFTADKVLRALVTEGEHRVVPAVPERPLHKRSAAYRKWKRSQRAYEFTEKWVNGLERPLKRVCWHLMEAVAFGHKLCEIELRKDGGNVVPRDISPKPRTAYQIRVDHANRVLGAKPANGRDAELVLPRNLLLMTVGGMDDIPTGEPALAGAYKPWQRKEGDLKNQGMSSRQSGGGFLVVEEAYPPAGVPYVSTVPVRQADGTLRDTPKGTVAAAEAAKIITGRAGYMPPGMSVELLQADGATVFDSALDRSDREMVMCFLGQARAILSSDSNSQADSGVAEGIALTMRDLYRGLLCGVIEAKFKEFLVLNLGAEYADVVPRYDIATEEGKDLVAVGNFLAGNFDRLTLVQKNALAAWIGLPDFPLEEDETEAIAREAQAEEEEEVRQFAARFSVAPFATRIEIGNEAAQKRMDRVVRIADRQFRSLASRLANGEISREEFRERFDLALATGHDRAYRIGFAHGGGGDTGGDTYLAKVLQDEGGYGLGLADAIARGEISEAEARRRASLYANRMRGTGNAAFRDASLDRGLRFFWELGPSDHCADCVRCAAASPWEAGELVTTPGEGGTSCGSNCTCRLWRDDGRRGFFRAPVSGEDLDGLPQSRNPDEIVRILGVVGTDVLVEARGLVAKVVEAQMGPVTADVVPLKNNNLGEYDWWKRQIHVADNCPAPRVTLAHEFGHAIWKDFVLPTLGGKEPEEALPEFVKVIEATKAIIHLRKLYGKDKKEDPTRVDEINKRLNYWTKPEEVFCRALAQIVANHAGSAAMRAEVERFTIRRNKFPAHWIEEEFVPLEEYLVEWLKTFGVTIKR